MRSLFESILDRRSKTKRLNRGEVMRAELEMSDVDFTDNFNVMDDTTIQLKRITPTTGYLINQILPAMMRAGVKTLYFKRISGNPRITIDLQDTGKLKGIEFDMSGVALQFNLNNEIEDCVFDVAGVTFTHPTVVKKCDFKEATLRTYNGMFTNLPTFINCKGGKEFVWSLTSTGASKNLTTLIGKAKKAQDARKDLFKHLGDIPVRLVSNSRVALIWQNREPDSMLTNNPSRTDYPNCHVVVAKL